MGLWGSNASGGRILPGAFWAHGDSKMATLGASLLLCVLQHFRIWEGMLPPGASRTNRASARRIVSCRALCASSLCPQIPHVATPTFVGFRFLAPEDRVHISATFSCPERRLTAKLLPEIHLLLVFRFFCFFNVG